MACLAIAVAACADQQHAASGGEERNDTTNSVNTELPDPQSLSWQSTVGQFESFEVQVPAEWLVEHERLPGGFMDRYILMKGKARIVQFAARCAVGASVADMIWQDSQIVNHLDGSFGVTGTRDIPVGGAMGKMLDYKLSFGGIPAEYRAVYFESPPCGWRLLLQAFGDGVKERFAPAFEHFVDTFVPRAFEPPFPDHDPYVPTRSAGGGTAP
ncbi:MAG TPA: hypothetical protein VNM43_11275 [Dehalococcoidia bacterium]|nr:hypothetical protein [Dehalococcoidia bacterium]